MRYKIPFDGPIFAAVRISIYHSPLYTAPMKSGWRSLTSTALLAATGLACSQGVGGTPTLLSSGATGPSPIVGGAPATAAAPVVITAGAATHKMTYRVGPVHLNPAQDAAPTPEADAHYAFQLPEAVWITGVETRVEDAAGNALPPELLHAAWLENHSEPNPFCTTGRAGNPFAAATAATKAITFPKGYGYAILPDDQLEANIRLRNPTKDEYAEVYFTFTLEGLSMNSGTPIHDVKPLVLEHDPCTHGSVAVEPGKYVQQDVKSALPTSGKVVSAYGLLQRNGVAVTLSKEADKTPFWQASAKLNANHEVSDLPSFQDSKGIPVKSGENLVLTVAYQNDSSVWFNDATAAALVFVAPTGDDPATAAKPYQTKSAVTATTVQEMLLP